MGGGGEGEGPEWLRESHPKIFFGWMKRIQFNRLGFIELKWRGTQFQGALETQSKLFLSFYLILNFILVIATVIFSAGNCKINF